jgi:hypothetical protein
VITQRFLNPRVTLAAPNVKGKNLLPTETNILAIIWYYLVLFGYYWIWIWINIKNADPYPGARRLTKFINKHEFQPFKKAYLTTLYVGTTKSAFTFLQKFIANHETCKIFSKHSLLLHVYNVNLTDVQKPAAGFEKLKAERPLGSGLSTIVTSK